VSNPPGLENTQLPAFWDLPGPLTNISDATVFPNQPNGVWPISGCYNTSMKPDGGICVGRVTHTNLTKDLAGGIAWQLGAGATVANPGNPRGKIAQNGQRAVTLAILEVRRQWQRLQDAVIAREGATRGAVIICALTHDDPVKDCNS
jgi:hypothetical protein